MNSKMHNISNNTEAETTAESAATPEATVKSTTATTETTNIGEITADALRKEWFNDKVEFILKTSNQAIQEIAVRKVLRVRCDLLDSYNTESSAVKKVNAILAIKGFKIVKRLDGTFVEILGSSEFQSVSDWLYDYTTG